MALPNPLVTAADYINGRVLRHAAQLRPGYTSSPELQQDILQEWQALIDEANTERAMPVSVPDYIYTITGPGFNNNNRDYQIGPTAADFVGPRPVRILKMNFIMSSVSPPIRLPIVLVPFDYYYSISALDISAVTVTDICYYEATYPNGVLHFWPPIMGAQIEIFTNGVLVAPATLTTTVAGTFPPGYENWIVYELAKRCQYLCTKEMGPRNPRIAAMALIAKQKLLAVNLPNPKCAGDFPANRAGLRQGVFSNQTWAAGEPY